MTSTDRSDFVIELAITAPPPDVFAALATLEGLAGWWTPLVTGTPSAGGELTFAFAGLDETITMRVEECTPSQRVTWTCLTHTGHPEWNGTTITFELTPSDTGCRLGLRHRGLAPNLDCYLVCASGWEMFLSSIADYCETGTGQPFPARAA